MSLKTLMLTDALPALSLPMQAQLLRGIVKDGAAKIPYIKKLVERFKDNERIEFISLSIDATHPSDEVTATTIEEQTQL